MQQHATVEPQDDWIARASIGAVAALALGTATYAAVFARPTEKARVVVLAICNSETDAEDVDHAVQQVFLHARHPQSVQLHIVSPLDAVLEHHAFRARRLARYLDAPPHARRAMHANTFISPAIDLRARHMRKDAQVAYLPILASAVRNVADRLHDDDTVLIALGAPGTFALKDGFDDDVVKQANSAVVNLAPDLAARVLRIPRRKESARALHAETLQRAREVGILAAEAARVPPGHILFAAERVLDDENTDNQSDDESESVAPDDTARILHPEALAARTKDWLTLFDIVQTRYKDALLRMNTSLPIPDATDWIHRAASRAGYGAYSALATPLLAGFGGKAKREQMLRARNAAPIARARFAECIALTLAAEALAPDLAVQEIAGVLQRDPERHAAIFPVCACTCAPDDEHAPPVGARAGPEQRLSSALTRARASSDA